MTNVPKNSLKHFLFTLFGGSTLVLLAITYTLFESPGLIKIEYTKFPERVIIFWLPEEGVTALNKILNDFASKRNFTVSRLKSGPTKIYTKLIREDASVTIINPFPDPSEFHVYLYSNQASGKLRGIDELDEAIRGSLLILPNVKLKEKLRQ